MQTNFFDKMFFLKYQTKNYLRYLYALLAVPIVILSRFALLPLAHEGTPFITLFPATVIIALLGGMGPAILTGVIGVMFTDYFFIPPLHSWDFGIEFWTRTSVVVLTSIFVGYVGAVLREARLRAENQAIELNRNKHDLNRAQTVAHTGSWRLDTRNNKLIWSDEAYRIFGAQPDNQLSYESFLACVHPDDREYVDRKWQEALKGEKYDIEHRIIVNDRVKWVHEKAELEYEKSGTLIGGFGTVTDITKRREMEEELRKSRDELEIRVKERTLELEKANEQLKKENEERLRTEQSLRLEEARLDALVSLSEISEEPLYKITGFALDQAIALTHSKIGFLGFLNEDESMYELHSVSKDVVEDCNVEGDPVHWPVKDAGIWAEAIRQRKTLFVNDYSKPHPRKKGIPVGHVPIERFMVVPVFDGDKIVTIAGVGNKETDYDKTDERQLVLLLSSMWSYVQKKKSGELVLAERQRFNDVLETLPVYVCLLTPDYYMPFANKVFRDLFGYYPDKKCYEFLFNRNEPCENCETYKVLKTNQPQHWEWTGPNGRNYDIFDFPFRDTDGSQLILEMGIDITERKQAQAAVQAERQRLYDVLETLPVMICLLTPDHHIAFANRSFRDKFGDSNGLHCYESCFGKNEPCDFCESYKVLETGQPHHWEVSTPDGNSVIDAYDFPFTDVDGSPLILEMDIDITEQKHAQEALRSASLYSRSLLEASLDPLVTISSEGKITDVNEATVQVTGVSRENLIGTDFSNYFTEPNEARKSYQQVFAKGFVTDYPLTIRHRDGHLTNVLYNATVYKNTHGETAGVFAAARDVTEKKQTEERQNATNSILELYARKTVRRDYLNAAVNVIREWSGCKSVGIRIKEDNGNIPYETCVGFEKDFIDLENDLHLDSDKCLCIRAILQEPNASDKELLTPGGSFYSNDSLAFVAKLTAEEVKDYRGQCMKSGFQSIGIIPIRYRDEVLGAIHIADTQKNMVSLKNIEFIESTIAPLIGEAIHRFNAEAELEKYRLHLEDIVKHRTEELARSNKDLEQFAYVASHDLQEPLRAVSGFVSLLQRQLQDSLNDKTKEYMHFTIDGVHRMQSLINGLLEYSRIDTRGKPPVKTDSSKPLEDAILSLQTSIEESGAKITYDKLPVVNIDPVQLAQLFQNLISNAIKFRGEKSLEIHISASHQDNAWKFAVKDNGIGIETQYSERIFLIFQRLHTRKQYPGTGIGLALCKKIVERHGGKIWFDSEPDKGSTFYFTIPDLEGEN